MLPDQAFRGSWLLAYCRLWVWQSWVCCQVPLRKLPRFLSAIGTVFALFLIFEGLLFFRDPLTVTLM